MTQMVGPPNYFIGSTEASLRRAGHSIGGLKKGLRANEVHGEVIAMLVEVEV